MIVTVTDVDEAGSGDHRQAAAAGIDRLLSARLRDEDDMVEDERWQWARSEERRDMDGHRGSDGAAAEGGSGQTRACTCVRR